MKCPHCKNEVFGKGHNVSAFYEEPKELTPEEKLQAKIKHWRDGYMRLRGELDEDAEKIKRLEEVFNQPNHDDPKCRYLYEVRNAIRLLEAFAKTKDGGEYAYGVAQQLKQFVKGVEQALKGKNAKRL